MFLYWQIMIIMKTTGKLNNNENNYYHSTKSIFKPFPPFKDNSLSERFTHPTHWLNFSTHSWRAHKKEVCCVYQASKEIHFSQWDLSFLFLPEKDLGHLESIWLTAWQRGFLMSWRKSLLLFPSKLPYRAISCIHHTPLPDPRRNCCIGSTPPPLPPHSLATSPPFSTTLPINRHQVALGDGTHT